MQYSVMDYLHNKPFADRMEKYDVIHAQDRLNELRRDDEKLNRCINNWAVFAAACTVTATLFGCTVLATLMSWVMACLVVGSLLTSYVANEDYVNQWNHHSRHRNEIWTRARDDDG